MTRNKEDPVKELEQSHEHWKDLYEHGGFGPSWADGVNLNLVRNHMLYYKGKIEELYPEEKRPDIYYEAVPDEVDNDYMARKDEILDIAVALYERCSGMKEVHDLLAAEEYLSKKELNDLQIQIDINRIRGLEDAIVNEDYVRLRSLGWDGEDRVQEIKEAHERLMSRQHQEGEQMNIFEMMM